MSIATSGTLVTKATNRPSSEMSGSDEPSGPTSVVVPAAMSRTRTMLPDVNTTRCPSREIPPTVDAVMSFAPSASRLTSSVSNCAPHAVAARIPVRSTAPAAVRP